MSKTILDKFGKSVGWIAEEIRSSYEEEVRYVQFQSDMIGCCVILINMGKTDFEIYDIINRYFGVDQISEIKKYVSAAHKWIEDNNQE